MNFKHTALAALLSAASISAIAHTKAPAVLIDMVSWASAQSYIEITAVPCETFGALADKGYKEARISQFGPDKPFDRACAKDNGDSFDFVASTGANSMKMTFKKKDYKFRVTGYGEALGMKQEAYGSP